MKDLLNENEVELNEAEQQEVEEAEKEIEQMQSGMDQAYLRIGKSFYAYWKETSDVIDAELDKICFEAKTIENDLEALEKKIVKIRQNAVCRKNDSKFCECGKENKYEARFCMYCGKKFEDDINEPVVEEKKEQVFLCPGCGKKIKNTNAAFCGFCGYKLQIH